MGSICHSRCCLNKTPTSPTQHNQWSGMMRMVQPNWRAPRLGRKPCYDCSLLLCNNTGPASWFLGWGIIRKARSGQMGSMQTGPVCCNITLPTCYFQQLVFGFNNLWRASCSPNTLVVQKPEVSTHMHKPTSKKDRGSAIISGHIFCKVKALRHGAMQGCGEKYWPGESFKV